MPLDDELRLDARFASTSAMFPGDLDGLYVTKQKNDRQPISYASLECQTHVTRYDKPPHVTRYENLRKSDARPARLPKPPIPQSNKEQRSQRRIDCTKCHPIVQKPG